MKYLSKRLRQLLIVPEIIVFIPAAISGVIFGACVEIGLKLNYWRTGVEAKDMFRGL